MEFYLRRLENYRTRIQLILFDPFQFHRSATTLEHAGLPVEPFAQTPQNLTLATESLYIALTNRRLKVYDVPDLRAHILNAVAVEGGRGSRLEKGKQSLKIDGAIALSFALVAAQRSGKIVGSGDPGYQEPVVESHFNPAERFDS